MIIDMMCDEKMVEKTCPGAKGKSTIQQGTHNVVSREYGIGMIKILSYFYECVGRYGCG